MWATRWDTFYSIQEQLGRDYNLDPCCVKDTAKCKMFITDEMDLFSYNDFSGIKQALDEDIQMFVNPPYGRDQKKFVEKIVDLCEYDGVVADVLIPARTDTALYHDVILPKASAIRFVKGRITFGSDEYWEWLWNQEYTLDGNGKQKKNSLYHKFGKRNAAPFPSMVVTFGESGNFEYGALKLDKESYDK